MFGLYKAVAPAGPTMNMCGYGPGSALACASLSGTTFLGGVFAAKADDLRALPLELSGGTEAPEILRRDRLQRIRRNPEALQGQAIGLGLLAHHIIAPQQLDLVRRQLQRARRELQD